MDEIIKNLSNKSIDFLLKILAGLIILIVGFKIINIIENKLKKPHKYSRLDQSVKTFLISFTTISLKILLTVIFLSVIGVPMASLVTIVGSCAVAIGLALQGGLSNIAGGLMILIFKPFKVGDFISVNGNEGTVKSITMFYTTITTIDNKTIQLPNGNLSNSNITNYTANEERRIDINLSVAYNTDINKVKKVVNSVIDKHKLILQDKEKTIRLSKHDESCLVFTLRVWVETINYWPVYFDLMEQIKEEFDKNNIEIPFNQLDIHMK